MTLAVWFWLFYVLSLVFGIWGEWTPVPGNPYVRRAWYLVIYLLLAIIGLRLFGSPVQ